MLYHLGAFIALELQGSARKVNVSDQLMVAEYAAGGTCVRQDSVWVYMPLRLVEGELFVQIVSIRGVCEDQLL
jgi:hypothetical protein